MRLIILISLIMQNSFLFASENFPNSIPGLGICSLSTRSDSYGKGIASAFTGEDQRHRYNDETCYKLGFEFAQGAIEAEGRANCEKQFNDTYYLGLQSPVQPVGTLCETLGFMAGRAALGVGAREADEELVGKECVSAYKKGVREGKAGEISTSRSTRFPESFCYQLGHYEFSLYN